MGPLFGEKTGEFGYQDPQVFSKIARARGLPDGKERTEQYQTINAQIAATVPGRPHRLPDLRAGALGPGPEATRPRRY